MKTNQHTDKNLRELEAKSLIMPSAHIWGNIEHSLDVKHSQKGFWLWTLGLVCLTGIIGILLNTTSHTEQITPSKQRFSSMSTIDLNAVQHNVQIHPNIETDAVLFMGEKEKSSDVAYKTEITTPKTAQITPEYNNSEKIASSTTESEFSDSSPSASLALDNKGASNNSVKSEADKNSINKQQDLPINSAGEEKLVLEEVADDPCPALTSRVKKHFFIEGGALNGYHIKQFDNSTEANTELRENTETSWYTWGGFAGVGIYVKPNIYISSNLELVQQKDLFDYSRDGISRMIIEYDPTTGEQLSSHTVSGSWMSQGEITRTTFDASLNVGYLFGNGTASRNAWQFGIEPGLIYNFNLVTKGKVMTAPDEISRLEEETLYQNNIGLGYQLHLIATKNMKKGLQLNIKPFYRSYLDSWSSSDSEALDIPVIGVKLGLRKIF